MKTKKRIFSIFLTLSILLMLLPVTVFADGATWYVAPGGGGNGSGSWGNASSDLNQVMTDASSGDQIWVAEGIYTPGDNETDTFTLKKGLKVYGGFVGGETSLEARNWTTNVTILSGNNKNYHVVTGQANATSDDTRLDGFTITLGKANGSGDNRDGGGMYNVSSSPTVANCIFTENDAVVSGAGMFNSDSSPTVVNCTFSGNTATYYGGGMYNSATWGNPEVTPTVENCTFIDNTADFGGGMYNRFSNSSVANCIFTENDADGGGGMCNYYSDPTLENCSFSNNTATAYGGGIYNESNSTATLINCTFSGNTADYGGGINNNNNSNPTVSNCIFSGNTAYDGGGMYNYDSNPTLTNCTFSGNTSSSGGGMYNRANSTATLINCTISGNTANGSGGGMCSSSSSSPTLANTIVWDNTAPADSGPDIYQDGATLNLKNCVVDWDKYKPVNTPTEDFTGVIQTDPKLVPLDKSGNAEPVYANAWIYGLGQGSSAIDAGLGVGETVNNAAIPNQDQRGTARPQGAGVDIGAFEAVLHTVTYNSNGGDGSMATVMAVEDIGFILPVCTFTAPAGKQFTAWAIGSADSATTINAGVEFFFMADTTVYALWSDIASQQHVPWTKGSDTPPQSFISGAAFEDLLGVKVDDVTVNPENYDAVEGSTIITFKTRFLETLSAGLHKVEIASLTGSAFGTLEIKAPTTHEIRPLKSSVPKTGDGMGIYTLPALMLLSAGTIILLIRRRKASQK